MTPQRWEHLLLQLTRVLHAARDRYLRLGAVRGTARVPALTSEERDALIALLGRYVRTRPGEELRIALGELDEAFRQFGVPGGLVEALEHVEGRPLRPLSEERREAEARRTGLFADIRHLGDHAHGRARAWLLALAADEGTAAAVLRAETAAAERSGDTAYRAIRSAVAAVADALAALPADRGTSARLPVLAARVTGDPHGLDPGTLAGRLLLAALTDQLGAACGVTTPPHRALERGVLLAAAGILVDGISSSVACFGLAAAHRPDGRADPLIAAAAAEHLPVLVPLRQVHRWRAIAVAPSPATGAPTVYTAENPAVFEELADAAAEARIPVTLVCTSGFPSVAAVRLLDLAAEAGATIAYGGDFDAKGLAMAASLIQRYGEHLRLWGMAPEDYAHAARHPLAGDLTTAERERLETYEASPGPLAPLARAMRQIGKRAYQEALTDRLRASLGLPPDARRAR